MLNRNKNGLEILESIIVDRKLPKYNTTSNFVVDGNSVITSGSSFLFNDIGSRNNERVIFKNYLNYRYANEPTILLKIKIFLYDILFASLFDEEKEKKDIDLKDLLEFFNKVKLSKQQLDGSNINDILANYEKFVNSAIQNNQTALIEKIEQYKDVLKYESLLIVSGFDTFLEEQDVVNFYNKCSRHEKFNTKLKLTYMKNFTKYIPEEVTTLKLKADSLNVFDNYVILHYDYDDSASSDTKEETEKKKDPILFGLIQGSKRLYFIADWIDYYCDLTFDKLITTIGKENTKLQDNITV